MKINGNKIQHIFRKIYVVMLPIFGDALEKIKTVSFLV